MSGENAPTKSPSMKIMVFSACFYGFCSGIMNIANKFILNTWSFRYPQAILTSQLLILIVGLKLLNYFKKVQLVKYNKQSALSCAILSFFFSTNTYLALFALSGMNLPMYSALRRCIPMSSAILSYFVLSKRPSHLVQIAVLVITIGAVIAAVGDMSFDLTSYAMGSLSIVLMACYLVSLQYTGLKDQLTSTDILYVNSCNCFPVIFLYLLASLGELLKFSDLGNPSFIASFCVVSALGALLNFSMFLCTTVNSALTTTCVGVIKSAFVTVIGMYAFGGATSNYIFDFGLLLNFVGGIIYAFAKYVENKQSTSEKQHEELEQVSSTTDETAPLTKMKH